jgi:hypothetical protein
MSTHMQEGEDEGVQPQPNRGSFPAEHTATAATDNGGPAFPVPEVRGPDGCGIVEGAPGMSLRDWFAGQALAGILAGPCSREGASLSEWADIPEHAYRIADMMLARKRATEG